MNKATARELFKRAERHYRRDRHPQAIALLRELDDAFPDNRAVLYAMALCHEGLDERDEALRLCDRLIRRYACDKAVILKARLITIPSDPPPDATAGFDAELSSVWPAALEAAAEQSRRAPAPPPPAGSPGLYVFCGIFVLMLLMLLPVFVLFFAQAETAVPGASPTLFPGRLLVIGAVFIYLAAAATTACFVRGAGTRRDRAAPSRPAGIALAAAPWMVPVLGWGLALVILRRQYRLSLPRLLLLGVVMLLLHLAALALITAVLSVTAPYELLMELRAGYG